MTKNDAHDRAMVRGAASENEKFLDFSDSTVDKLEEQMCSRGLSICQKLHYLRLFAKFKRYFLTKYQVYCKELGITVNYIYDGRGYNFVIRTAPNCEGKVIVNTKDADEKLAKVLYDSTKWLVLYIESSASYNVYHEAKRAGYLIGASHKLG